MQLNSSVRHLKQGFWVACVLYMMDIYYPYARV